LKENVIIGKLIPAGTGFVHGRFSEELEARRMAEVTGSGPSPDGDDGLADIELSLAD